MSDHLSRPEASWLDRDPPENASLAEAWRCEMDYFLDHTATGGHLPCSCSDGQGHNDPHFEEMFNAEI